MMPVVLIERRHLLGYISALVACVTDDMMHAQLAGHLHRAIGRSIINDKELNGINAGDLTRDVRQRWRQCLLFVETWNLYNELHEVFRPPPPAPAANWHRQPSTVTPEWTSIATRLGAEVSPIL